MNTPKKCICTDTEPETSIDLDASVAITGCTELKCQNATKSVFNITWDDNFDDHASIKYRDYENRLQEEEKQWLDLYKGAIADLKKSKEALPIIDIDTLSQDNKDYLKKAPNMQDFIRESLEFRKMAHDFFKNQYADSWELQNNLVELGKFQLSTVKHVKDCQLLANE